MSNVEPRPLDPQAFPESTASAPGMRVITADTTPRFGSVALGVPYAQKSGRTLHLQVILPPRPLAIPDTADDVYPALLWIQGSAFHEQDLGHKLPALADFARRGYVVAIVEYRPSEVAPFPAQAKDAKTAVRWLREHAARFHVDPDRIVLGGDSSGGHTALMTYVTQDDQDYSDEPVADELGICCFIAFYPVTDITTMHDQPSALDHVSADSPEGYLIGRHNVLERPDLVAPTVIANHVAPAAERPLQPLLMMHGSRDRLVPFAQSVELYERLVAAGQDVTLYQLKGADHGGPPFWQPPVTEIMDAFIRRHLP
ncbi:alpha/beta hydrolase [Raineyella fluvialis]|uniref:Alpha/beta hydrolase fold domain-containing protein n=1 Tax=Raineyella fluvialis TaxID=2662261 RepID=A0A5Q2FIU5_9ACTN|nr:alpha/beta hydrolase [Raineyella fluvialis]QGF24565.1 alpha/beta hydrolase fold domain-containing protein [Raineyella fluvialis]